MDKYIVIYGLDFLLNFDFHGIELFIMVIDPSTSLRTQASDDCFLHRHSTLRRKYEVDGQVQCVTQELQYEQPSLSLS